MYNFSQVQVDFSRYVDHYFGFMFSATTPSKGGQSNQSTSSFEMVVLTALVVGSAALLLGSAYDLIERRYGWGGDQESVDARVIDDESASGPDGVFVRMRSTLSSLWQRFNHELNNPAEMLERDLSVELSCLEAQAQELDSMIKKLDNFAQNNPALFSKAAEAWQKYQNELVRVPQKIAKEDGPSQPNQVAALQREVLAKETKLNNYRRFLRDHPAIAEKVREILGENQPFLESKKEK